MRWSNLARSALFSVAICCVIPEAEAVEVFAAPGFAAQADMVTPARYAARGGAAVRGPRGGVAVRGGSVRGGAYRGGAYPAAAQFTAEVRIAATATVATAIARTAMARRRSERRRLERLPRAVAGSTSTAPESVTPTNLTALTSLAKGGRSKGNVRADWRGHSALKTRKTTPCTSSAEATSLDAAQVPASGRTRPFGETHIRAPSIIVGLRLGRGRQRHCQSKFYTACSHTRAR